MGSSTGDAAVREVGSWEEQGNERLSDRRDSLCKALRLGRGWRRRNESQRGKKVRRGQGGRGAGGQGTREGQRRGQRPDLASLRGEGLGFSSDCTWEV